MFGGYAVGLRIVFISAVLGCGLFCAAGSPAARAQHVVTDVEAGKLTLDALTATPRPIYRQVAVFRRMHRSNVASRSSHVHYVTYRRRSGRSVHH